MTQLSFDADVKPRLFTAGYQGRTLDQFVRLLVARGVRQVIDVREHPTSRRPGFAKTPLSRALELAGIAYVHVREAGNPFRHEAGGSEAILEHPRSGARKFLLEKYARHVDAHPEIVEAVVCAAESKTSVLVCFERNPQDCHRTALAERVADRMRVAVVAL